MTGTRRVTSPRGRLPARIVPPMNPRFLQILLGGGLAVAASPAADTFPAEQIEFFEKQIRPVLAENCYDCHGDHKHENGLRVDLRSALLRGSDYGKVVEPGNPAASKLIKAIQHAPGVEAMPKKGDKLKPEQIAALEKWVQMGLPWPEEKAAADAHAPADPMQHWAYQPVKRIPGASIDPLVEKKEAAKALARFLRHHPHNLASKVEVMVEHFRAHTRHKIGGRAKAMVVTDSRLSAVRYKQAFDKYINDKGYKDIKTLVAFSGTVDDPDFKGRSYSEQGMNGFPEKQLPEKFETEEYQVLIVAEKYQTGFDQPLLHTMYVDKRLDGVQAVQTLSRLNRTCAGKEDTFVLDFYNEREDIFRAFKPYYEATAIAEDVDPHKLYELKAKLDGAHVYYPDDVKALCAAFFGAGDDAGTHAKLYKLIDPAVERFKALDETAQDDFRGWLQSFRNLYGFLSQVIPYQDSALEALHTYLRFLGAKLPLPLRGKPLELDDDVQLKFYRLQKIGEGQIPLHAGEPQGLYGPSEVGIRRSEPEKVALSSLIEQLNERFGTDFRPADQLFFDQVEADAAEREDIQQAAKANTIDNFKLLFDKELEGLFVDRMEGNDEIFRRVMQDEQFRALASAYLMNKVYEKARRDTASGS